MMFTEPKHYPNPNPRWVTNDHANVNELKYAGLLIRNKL